MERYRDLIYARVLENGTTFGQEAERYRLEQGKSPRRTRTPRAPRKAPARGSLIPPYQGPGSELYPIPSASVLFPETPRGRGKGPVVAPSVAYIEGSPGAMERSRYIPPSQRSGEAGPAGFFEYGGPPVGPARRGSP